MNPAHDHSIDPHDDDDLDEEVASTAAAAAAAAQIMATMVPLTDREKGVVFAAVGAFFEFETPEENRLRFFSGAAQGALPLIMQLIERYGSHTLQPPIIGAVVPPFPYRQGPPPYTSPARCSKCGGPMGLRRDDSPEGGSTIERFCIACGAAAPTYGDVGDIGPARRAPIVTPPPREEPPGGAGG
jgi:hypothetical protein